MKPAPSHLFTVVAGCMLLAGAACADTLLLDNGDRISGRIQRYDSNRYEIETPYAGTLRVDDHHVVGVEMDHDVTVVMEDRTRRVGRLVVLDGHMTVQRNPDVPAVSLERTAVVTMYQGRQPEDDWRLSGRIALGASDTAGNSQVRRANFDGELTARRDLDRVTLNGRGNEATQRGTDTEANATAGLKYDRFVSKRWYAYGGATLEHDQLKELRLRRTFGAGSGYQVIDSARTSLALEGGLDRVLTDFFGAASEQAIAARLALRFDHWIVEERAQLFHYEQNYLTLSALSTSFLRTQTGLRLPINQRLSANVQFNVDWDGDPAPGRKHTDRALVFSIGYRW